MPQRIVVCDDAIVPASVTRSSPLRIRSAGNLAKLTLRIQPISDPLTGTVSGRAEDLVRIAAYAYWTDQLISRGGSADVPGDDWHRNIAMYIPVTDPDFWSGTEIRTLLQDALGFVSDDDWTFQFSKGAPLEKQLSLGPEIRGAMSAPDSVALFSGGADSLCAVVEAAAGGRRPALVSHWPVTTADARQRNLHALLRAAIPSWDFPRVSVLVNKANVRERDTSQRARSFLFAALGCAVADALRVQEVILADNGVVSLNLPINDQLLGALATRSTHPRFIWLLNALLRCVLPGGPQAANPLKNRTRAEALEILKGRGIPELLQESNSCSKSRGLPNATPHCGACSQCIDRRFATSAAGLEEHDLAERYKKDMFRYPLADDDLTTAESYTQFVQTVERLSDDDIFHEFPQLHECLVADDPDPEATAREYIAMLRRHATTTLGVVEHAIADAKSDLAHGTLPPTCLIRIAIAAASQAVEPAVQEVSLTVGEDAEAQRHRLNSRVSIKVLGQMEGRKSNVIWVGAREVILPDAQFRLFVRLVAALHSSPDGFVELGSMKSGGGLVDEGLFQAEGIYQAIGHLRARVGAVGDLRAKDFIQVQRGRIRLCTHRRYVSVDRSALMSHLDERVREAARRLPAGGRQRRSR